MGPELLLLLPFLIPFGLFALVVLISSAVRHTSPRAGFSAIAWTIPIWVVASVLAGALGPPTGDGAFWLTGTVLTTVVLLRARYKWGWSWLLFVLGPIGWWLLIWRSNNQQDAERKARLSQVPAASPIPN